MPPAHLIDWTGKDWTPEVRDPRRSRQRPLHRAGRPGSGHRPELGRPGRRADRRDHVRRPPGHHRAARPRGLRLGARRLPRLDHELRDDRRGLRHDRQAALRPVRDAAVLRLQHGRLLGPLAGDRAGRRAPSCRASTSSTGSARTPNGKFIWPGFGENSRVIEWIFGRCSGEDDAVATPIGFLPAPGAHRHDRPGYRRRPTWPRCFQVDPAAWVAEAAAIEEHYARFGSKLPAALAARLDQMKTAIAAA